MPYDERLAERVREVLKGGRGVSERKMFGGLAFMLRGNMSCGVLEDRLMVRVGPESYEKALTLKHAYAMDFTGRPMRGFVYVSPEGVRTRAQLERWVERGVTFARSFPPK